MDGGETLQRRGEAGRRRRGSSAEEATAAAIAAGAPDGEEGIRPGNSTGARR
jgi:hypothetical protein